MTFHKELRERIDEYVHGVYAVSRDFPKEELYGVVSQLRRAALSVALNYIEGYARLRSLVRKNFTKIAYGSLQESIYLLRFSFEEKYLNKEKYETLCGLADSIGKMLWGILQKM